MKNSIVFLVSMAAWLCTYNVIHAEDWPQWRGPSRNGTVSEFKAPNRWPQELTQKWQVTVGEGVATPALVAEKIYVIGRQGNEEVTRCLDANTGDEVWSDSYQAAAVRGPAGSFSGPRCSVSVSDGKVVLMGVQGVVSCFEAASGKMLWRNDEREGTVPKVAASSSPLIVGGLCIVQLGSEENGGIFAFDLASGDQKWQWRGDGPCNGSPIAATIGDVELLVAPTAGKVVALRVRDGEELFELPYTQGRYNAATPIVEGETLILAGPDVGISARKLSLSGEEVVAEESWTNRDNSVRFNTPVVRNGHVFGLSDQNILFCIDIATGKTTWDAPIGANSNNANVIRSPNVFGQQRERQGRRRRRGGGRGGFGSVISAGSVLMALTPEAELTVIALSNEEYKELAKHKVADAPTRAYPIVSGNRIFVKDQEKLTLWTF